MSELTKHLIVDKNINKHNMKKNHLCNSFPDTKSDIDRKSYNTQQNLYVRLIRQTKKQCFSNRNTNVVTDNKAF